MPHHTKDKGDQGLGQIIAALLSNGIQVALPISEHLPFDCIAVSPEGRLCRLSVKYRTAKNGVVAVRYRSSWADRHGVHTKSHDMTSYDATAIYCPDFGGCYFVRNDEVTAGMVTLRVEPPKKHGWQEGIRSAGDFVDPRRLFSNL